MLELSITFQNELYSLISREERLSEDKWYIGAEAKINGEGCCLLQTENWRKYSDNLLVPASAAQGFGQVWGLQEQGLHRLRGFVHAQKRKTDFKKKSLRNSTREKVLQSRRSIDRFCKNDRPQYVFDRRKQESVARQRRAGMT